MFALFLIQLYLALFVQGWMHIRTNRCHIHMYNVGTRLSRQNQMYLQNQTLNDYDITLIIEVHEYHGHNQMTWSEEINIPKKKNKKNPAKRKNNNHLHMHTSNCSAQTQEITNSGLLVSSVVLNLVTRLIQKWHWVVFTTNCVYPSSSITPIFFNCQPKQT